MKRLTDYDKEIGHGDREVHQHDAHLEHKILAVVGVHAVVVKQIQDYDEVDHKCNGDIKHDDDKNDNVIRENQMQHEQQRADSKRRESHVCRELPNLVQMRMKIIRDHKDSKNGF